MINIYIYIINTKTKLKKCVKNNKFRLMFMLVFYVKYLD